MHCGRKYAQSVFMWIGYLRLFFLCKVVKRECKQVSQVSFIQNFTWLVVCTVAAVIDLFNGGRFRNTMQRPQCSVSARHIWDTDSIVRGVKDHRSMQIFVQLLNKWASEDWKLKSASDNDFFFLCHLLTLINRDSLKKVKMYWSQLIWSI